METHIVYIGVLRDINNRSENKIMKFYIYTSPLRSKRKSDFLGTLVKITREKENDLDDAGIRRYTLLDKDHKTFSRWSVALSQGGLLCEDGFSIVPQTEEEFISKISGRTLVVTRTENWKNKLEISR